MNRNDKITNKVVELINKLYEDIIFTEKMYNEDITQICLDSIGFMMLVVLIEEEFNVEIPAKQLNLEKMNTINKISNIIRDLIKN